MLITRLILIESRCKVEIQHKISRKKNKSVLHEYNLKKSKFFTLTLILNFASEYGFEYQKKNCDIFRETEYREIRCVVIPSYQEQYTFLKQYGDSTVLN